MGKRSWNPSLGTARATSSWDSVSQPPWGLSVAAQMVFRWTTGKRDVGTRRAGEGTCRYFKTEELLEVMKVSLDRKFREEFERWIVV